MRDSDYYPAGAYNDPKAPWNEPADQDYVDVEVCASVTLSRNATIPVNDYSLEEWYDADIDDEGHPCCTRGTDYNFSDCDLKTAFKESEYSISKLLEILRQYAEADKNGSFHTEGKVVDKIIESCDAWDVDEEEVIRE